MPLSTPLPARSTLGSFLWLGCFQFFLGEQIARLGWVGKYSMQRNYISDLGAVHCVAPACSSLYRVMNGSFILQGCLIFFGTLLVRKLFPAAVNQIALALLAIAGAGVLLVGVAPEDVDFRLHILGAAGNFLAGNLAMILLGLAGLRRSSRSRNWFSLAAGSVGLLATLALTFRGAPSLSALGWPVGTVERFAAYPLPLWLTCTGFLLLRERPRDASRLLSS